MVANWPSFQACVASGDRLKALLARDGSDRLVPSGNSGEGGGSSALRETCWALGPNGILPPAYLDDGRLPG